MSTRRLVRLVFTLLIISACIGCLTIRSWASAADSESQVTAHSVGDGHATVQLSAGTSGEPWLADRSSGERGFETLFSSTGDASVKFSRRDCSVSFYPVTGSGVERRCDANRVIYDEVWPMTTTVYTVESNSLKEEIILRSARAGNTFSFRIGLNGVTPVVLADGSIEFLDSRGERAFEIPAPFAYDSAAAPSVGRVYTRVRSESGQLYIDLVVEPEWLNSPDRVFPVIVDPTVSVSSSGTSSQYFNVNGTGTITWNCTIVGGYYQQTQYRGEFYVYDPSGRVVVHQSTTSLTAKSYSGTVEVFSSGDWRVVVSGTRGAGGQGSVTYPYETPPTVTQVSPSAGATVSTPSPEVSWSFADPNGHWQDSAEVQFSKDSSFGTGCLTSTVTSSATRAVPPYALSNGVWYWRVRCECSRHARSAWSPARSFTVAVNQPVIPGLLTVSEGGTGSLKISWPAAVNTPVSAYYLDIGTTPNGSEFAALTVSGTSSIVSVPSDLVLYATVRAIGPMANIGPRSNPADLGNLEYHFSAAGVAKKGYFTISQPGCFPLSGTATAHTGTTHLGRVEILDPNNVVQMSRAGSGSWSGMELCASPNQLGRWTIDARNDCSVTSVSVDVEYTRNLAPTLRNLTIENMAPETASVNTTLPLIRWRFYDPEWWQMGTARFMFSQDQGFTGSSTFATETTEGTSIVPSAPLTEGRWYWKSQVSDEWDVWSPWSPVRTLIVDVTKPTTPANAQVTQSPSGERVLSWSPSTDPFSHGASSGIKGYYVYAGSQPGLFDLLNEQFVAETQITLPATSYAPYCMVRAVDNAGNTSEGTSDRSVHTSWDYDENGNRVMQMRNGVVTFCTYDDLNRLTYLATYPDGTHTVTFEYDANGNQTKRIDQTPERAETWEYAYDDLNRLVCVKKDAAVLAAYAYDAFGRRVKAVQNNKLAVFIYSGIDVIYEETYDAPGDPIAALDLDLTTVTPVSTVDYIRGNGQLVAKVSPGTDPTGYLQGEVATYFHLDHLGSTRVQTDQAGNVVTRIAYEPFGEYLAGGVGSELYAYTGQRNEGITGLYYYGARFYDPAIGRFITQDPIGDGLNWFAYCGNNPIMFVDPTGMKLAVGSTIEDEDDTVEGQHVWTGDPDYDNLHAKSEINGRLESVIGADPCHNYTSGASQSITVSGIVIPWELPLPILTGPIRLTSDVILISTNDGTTIVNIYMQGKTNNPNLGISGHIMISTTDAGTISVPVNPIPGGPAGISLTSLEVGGHIFKIVVDPALYGQWDPTEGLTLSVFELGNPKFTFGF